MRRERNYLFLWFVACWLLAVLAARGEAHARVTDGMGARSSTKITMCHARTIRVGQGAVPAHLAHGDWMGECPAACEEGIPSPVQKTGQTQCWDQVGSQIDCAGTGQDGEYQRGVSLDPRFSDNGDGTVNDNLTGLIWLKNANCFGEQIWADAIVLSNTLASGFCGLTDGSVAGNWRLPNFKELQSLIDISSLGPALPTGHPFTGVGFNNYWSSTTSPYEPTGAWVVHLGNGGGTYYKSARQFVWPVRGGQ